MELAELIVPLHPLQVSITVCDPQFIEVIIQKHPLGKLQEQYYKSITEHYTLYQSHGVTVTIRWLSCHAIYVLSTGDFKFDKQSVFLLWEYHLNLESHPLEHHFHLVN